MSYYWFSFVAFLPESQKDMDALIDGLADGSIQVSDIPIMQEDPMKLVSRAAAKNVVQDTSKSNSFKYDFYNLVKLYIMNISFTAS